MMPNVPQDKVDLWFQQAISYLENGFNLTQALKEMGVCRTTFYNKITPEEIQVLKKAKNSKNYIQHNLNLQINLLKKGNIKSFSSLNVALSKRGKI